MKTANKDNGKTIVNPLSKAIEEFKKQIDPKKDYAQLGGKGRYLTVPYRLKFIREYFGDRIRIITISDSAIFFQNNFCIWSISYLFIY